jgi:uncharacterized membrane protein
MIVQKAAAAQFAGDGALPPSRSEERMQHKYEEVARKLLGAPYGELDENAQRVARHLAGHTPIARNTAQDEEEAASFGQRAADAIARFGGSWAFILAFIGLILFWVALNSLVLARYGAAFDAYPYILLNLFLSMLASVQAPLILMSQNRQAEKDRANAEHDYEVNLKAELEIMLLHEKIDALRETQWRELVAMQAQQIELLERLAAKQG